MRRNILRFDGYGPNSCFLIGFLAELFARKPSHSQTKFRFFKGEHYMKTTAQTQALVRQDSEPNAPTDKADASQSRVPEWTQGDVAKLAYDLWQKRDSTRGSADEDWLQAERKLRESSEHVFALIVDVR
jgi:Protein of unknown function (DUF2934)